jgi:WD40 repeat protein
MKYYILFFAILLSIQKLNAQTLNLFGIDASNFPTIKGKFYAFDAAGQQQRPGISELKVIENGMTRTIANVSCPVYQPPRAISSVLVVDVSGSMKTTRTTESNMEIAKSAARIWVNELPLGKSECAITSFDNSNYLNQDFTTDRTSLLNAIDPLTPLNGTDYDAAFLHSMAGGLLVTNRAKHSRVIVFLTDGQGNGSESTILAEAIKQNCTIFCVAIGMSAPAILKNISTSTGGSWYENVASKQEIETIYRTILHQAQSTSPCEIIWTSSPSCTLGNRTVELQWNTTNSKSDYPIPNHALASVSVSPSIVLFANRKPLTSSDTVITISAQNYDCTVTDIKLKFGSPSYSIVNTSFPIVIPKNSSKTCTVRFTPVDSTITYANFEIETDICSGFISLNGGFPTMKSPAPTIKLTHPNGGEVFGVGGDTVITWDGIASTDTVRIEYSSDSGKVWSILTDKASGLKYPWQNIPKPASDNCKIKVKLNNSSNETQAATAEMLHTLQGHASEVNSVEWSPDGSRVVTTGDDKTAIVWSAYTGAKIVTFSDHIARVRKAVWNIDGTKIVSVSDDKTVKIWSANSGQIIFTLTGHNSRVMDVAWSPDGTKIATAGADQRIIIWSAIDGAKLYTFYVSGGTFRSLVWSPDGTKIATASDLDAIVWNAISGTKLFTYKGHTNTVYSVNWSPDGTKLVTASYDKTASVWSAVDGKKMFDLIGHKSLVLAAEWSPDGTTIVTGCMDSTVRLWSDIDGSMLQTLKKHVNYVYSVEWSSDGSKLLSASYDSTAIVWSATTGNVLCVLRAHTSVLTNAFWSPNDSHIATLSNDSTVKIWQFNDGVFQVDESDSVFRVINSLPASRDIDLRQCLIGTEKDSVIERSIENTGSIPLRIDSISITGADASLFSIVSGMPPYSIEPGGGKSVEFRFRPQVEGVKSAQVHIYTQADTLLQVISGEGVTGLVEILEKYIDFGRVREHSLKDTLQAVTIKNTRTVPLTITNTYHSGPNDTEFSTLSGGGQLTLNAGDTARLNLRFAPKTSGRTSGRLMFEYDGAGSPATVQLFGEGICGINSRPTYMVGLGTDIPAVTGAVVNVPVVVKLQTGQTLDVLSERMYCALSFDASMLFPLEPLPIGQIIGNRRVVQVEVQRIPGNDTLFVFPFLTMLGADSVVTVRIDSMYFDDGECPINVQADSVRISMIDICTAGNSSRLLAGAPTTRVMLVPNPADDNPAIILTLTEDTPVTLSIFNALGQELKNVLGNYPRGSHRLNIDVADVPSGMYSLRLMTRSEAKVVQFIKR